MEEDEFQIDDLTAKVLDALANAGEDAFALAKIAEIDPEKFRMFLAEYGETENPDALELLKAAESLRQWTLMFFFASGNMLSPSTLSQVKAIKAAGSQVNTKVLVCFANERGAPTRVLEINRDQAQRLRVTPTFPFF
jgi:hypothetical protein